MINEIRNGHHLTIKLNRPEVKNAFNPEMIAQLTKAFKAVAKDKTVKSVTIEGEGPVFCAGADLAWMQSLVNKNLAQNKKDSEKLYEMFQALWQIPVPVICLVQGAAFGGALGLMACADYVICDEKAQISFSEVKLGIAPAVISEFILKKCNISLIQSWMISGLLITPQEAEKSGLIHKVVSADKIKEEYERYVKSIGDSGPQAIRETKKMIRDFVSSNFKSTSKKTTSLIAKLRVSPEGQEGLKSFLEKRKPSWRA